MFMQKRICSRCKKEGDFTVSEKNRRWQGGYCRPCKSVVYKAYRIKNKEVLNQRAKERREHGSQSWYLAIKRGMPNTYQLLCHNCNHSKGVYGICPHQEK